MRLAFAETLDRSLLGERTKRTVSSLATRIADLEPSMDPAATLELAIEVLTAAGLKTEKKKGEEPEIGYLLFLSNRQLDNLAAAAIESRKTEVKLDKNKFKAIANTEHSVDIAMFGRMVADHSDINVDAACQVSHALSVHAVDNEFDYFTAVDDRKSAAAESGAGMIGTIEFNSATLYRYATVDVDRLHETLGDATATRAAVEAFVEAFTRSMPSGKQNTFANRTLPDAVLVRVRRTQPINMVGAFETPIRESSTAGRIELAANALVAHLIELETAFGEQPAASWVTHVGERTAALASVGELVTFPELVSRVGELVRSELGQPA
jgi:CRISPR system Cascade subunit CasC